MVWGKNKAIAAEDTRRFIDEAKAQNLDITFNSGGYGRDSMSPEEAIARILKSKTNKLYAAQGELDNKKKDLPYFYTLATKKPGLFNFWSERELLDYDNHPLQKMWLEDNPGMKE